MVPIYTLPMLGCEQSFWKPIPVWANHGDAISTQYSGTPALKGDFVR
jgi:hypothetical protein